MKDPPMYPTWRISKLVCSRSTEESQVERLKKLLLGWINSVEQDFWDFGLFGCSGVMGLRSNCFSSLC